MDETCVPSALQHCSRKPCRSHPWLFFGPLPANAHPQAILQGYIRALTFAEEAGGEESARLHLALLVQRATDRLLIGALLLTKLA